jgi:hypothetical protein
MLTHVPMMAVWPPEDWEVQLTDGKEAPVAGK